MQSIKKIKEELAMKFMAGTLQQKDFRPLPKNNELRTFICSLGPTFAYWHALLIDFGPREDTRIAASKLSWSAYFYAALIDKSPTEETRTGACKDSENAYFYAEKIDKKPTDITREAAGRENIWRRNYERFERKYYEEQRY
jgi:hypothetical protein